MTVAAQIILNQDRPGSITSAGTAGVARDDLWVGQVIRPTSQNTGTYQWTLLDKPGKSNAVLAGVTAQTCSFTPDRAGSYRIQLTLNGGGPGNVQVLIAACRYNSAGVLIARGLRIPAFGEIAIESNFPTNNRGWAASIEALMAGVEAEGAITVGPLGSGAIFETDGIADDVELNAAITLAATTGAALVKILPGSFNITAPVTLQSAVALQGSGRDATKLVVDPSFSSGNYYVLGCLGQETSATSGTTAGVAVPLLNDATQGNPTIAFTPSAETAPIAVGDFLMVQSSAQWEATNLGGTGRLCGEYVEVLAISNALGASTLTGAITSSQTTLTVASASSFTSALPFNIRVEGETMTVTAIAGNVLTVTRGVASQNGPAFATIAGTHGITTTITGAITASQTTLVTPVSSGWPIVPFRAKIESETIYVTNVSSTTITCVRGYDGTTAATHADATAINTVLPVNAGWIETSSYMRDAYYVTDAACFYRITFVKNFEVSDLQMSQGAPRGTRTGNPPALLGLIRARRATIRNCYFHDNDGPGVSIYQCLDVGVHQNIVEKLVSDPTNSRYGYGCLIGGASERVVVSGNRFGQVRHGVDAGPSKAPSTNGTNSHGVPRGVLVEGNVVMNSLNASLSTHCESEGWAFVSNHISHSNDAGINLRGRHTSVLSNTIEWCGQGIVVGNPIGVGTEGGSAAGSHVVGNSIRWMKALPSTGSTGVGIQLQVTDHVQVKNNAISECDSCGIELKNGVVGSIFSNNTITDCNLANRNGSLSDGISIDAGRTSATSSLTFSGGVVTLTNAGLACDPSYVGRKVTVSGAATAGNNGVFVITAIPTTTSVTYVNASGATDANNGSITYVLENNTDNIFEYNTVRNNPPSKYIRNGGGLMQSLVRDYGIAGHNERNIYRYNKALGLSTTTTNPIRTNGASYTAENNDDALGVMWSGNEKVTFRRFRGNALFTDGATPATNSLFTFTVSALKASTLKGSLIAVDATGTQRLYYGIASDYGNPAGTATQNAPTPVTEEYETTTSATVTADVSGTSGRVRVLGIANTSLRWEYDLTLTELAL